MGRGPFWTLAVGHFGGTNPGCAMAVDVAGIAGTESAKRFTLTDRQNVEPRLERDATLPDRVGRKEVAACMDTVCRTARSLTGSGTA